MKTERKKRILNRKRKQQKRILRKLLLFYSTIILTILLMIFFQNKSFNKDNFVSTDTAQMEKDILQFAKEHQISLSSYPPEILEMLHNNPETKDFVFNYPLEHSHNHSEDLSDYSDFETVPILMQWDTRWGYIPYAGEVTGLSGCGPLCLSMVGLYLTGDQDRFRPDSVLHFAQTNNYAVDKKGSKWSLITEGGQQLGLNVSELPLDRYRIEQNLNAHHPIICAMGPGDFTTTGHFIVLTGSSYLEDTGEYKITVNDPNSLKNSSRLWSYEEIAPQIKNLWAIQ